MTIAIPITKGYTALVDEADAHLALLRWRACEAGNGRVYAMRNFKRDGKVHTVYLHRAVTVPPEGMVVDHINGDTLDNTRGNLRVVTQVENMRNVAGARRDSRSGVLGVYADGSRWLVQIRSHGRAKYIGRYDTLEAAKAAREAAELEAFGPQPRRSKAQGSASPPKSSRIPLLKPMKYEGKWWMRQGLNL